jgi:competence protein ComEC
LNFIQQNPFIRLLAFYIAGIVLVNLLDFPIGQSLLMALVGIGLLLLIVLQKLNYYHQFWWGVVLSFVLLAFAAIRVSQFNGRFSNALSQVGSKGFASGIVLDVPKENSYGQQVLVLVQNRKESGHWDPTRSKVLLQIAAGAKNEMLKPGDEVVFSGKFSPLIGPRNPFDFNYAAFMQNKQVYEKVSVQPGEYKILPQEFTSLRLWALNFRQGIISRYKDFGIEGEPLHVLSALTLGYKDKLSAELRQDYAGAGAMHVLAVSGLHVGLIYELLLLLFKPLLLLKKWRKYVFLIVLFAIWSYALIAGLPPSVCRAATMFSFIVLGKILNRQPKIYNSIAASAFLLLVLNPSLLYDVGFQLSYMAVLGIVFFFPRINRLLYFKNIILRKAWEGIAVALAAQLATTPIGLYYFQQFPVYFWLSSLFVVLFAFVLMWATVLFLLLSVWDVVAAKMAWCIAEAITFMNLAIHWVNKIPGAVLKVYVVDPWIMTGLFLFMILVSVFLILQKTKYLHLALSVLLLMVYYHSYQSIVSQQQKAISVYHIPNTTAVHLVEGTNAIWVLADTAQNQHLMKCREQARIYWKTKEEKIYLLGSLDSMPRLGKSFCICRNAILYNDFELLLGRGNGVDCTELSFMPDVKLYANGKSKIDSTVPALFSSEVKPWDIDRLKRKNKIRDCYYTLSDGAWEMRFE